MNYKFNKNFLSVAFSLLNFAPLRLCAFALIFSSLSLAQTLAPGAPGNDAQWATAGKQGVGTSASLDSKVWFTLANGVLTEVYYPDVTVANVHLLQFVVVDPKTKKVETEQADAVHQIKVLRPDSLTFQQINTAKSGMWTISKTYTTDPERNTVLIDVQFEPKNEGLNLYVYYDPSLGNSGLHDWTASPVAAVETESERIDFDGKRSYLKEVWNTGMVAEDKIESDEKIASVVLFSSNISELTNGFYGVSDGLDQLRKFGKIQNYYYAEKGNTVQMAKIDEPKSFTVSLGFANDDYNLLTALGNADDSLKKGFRKCLEEYEKGWAEYVKTLRKVEPKYQEQFNMAAMILKAHEDKRARGANIASLSVPWGGGANANENNIGGYHLVWSRDLYQVFTAYMALGDTAAAERALDFLFKVQQKADGSFPQNSYLDGKPFWGSLQMDEVAYPLIMAWQLKRFDRATWQNHIKRAADFIVKNGPATPQERWEEEAGYSPSTIAAEIAGLVCAAEIAKANNDPKSARTYLETADEWAANVEKWTVTKTGKHSKQPYYLRITQNGKPDAGSKIELNNGAGVFDEREIVDAGFLELVRLGIKSPDDPVIQNSVRVIDQVIRVNTPNGDGFYRYNNDGYGEMDDGRRWNFDGKYTGKGRLWALLSGERGQYELALYNTRRKKFYAENKSLPRVSTPAERLIGEINVKARNRLDAMLAFANEGLMIPEQIWDKSDVPKNIDKQFIPELKFGEGTGSATPLAWSMAQFIRLAVNLQEGKNLDTPQVVYDRYVLGKRNGELELMQSKGEIPVEIKSEVITVLPKGVEFADLLKRRSTDSIARDCYENPLSSPSRFTVETAKQILSQKKIEVWRCSKHISIAFIIYYGKAESVEVVGDFTNWKPEGLKLEKIDSSLEENIRYISLGFSNSARVEYKLIVDGKWINDPANPNKIDNGVGGENSVFTMPDYKATEWDKEFKRTPTFPSVSELEIESKKFGKRTVKIYVPSIYYKRSVLRKLPVLYLQDGSDYIARAKAIDILENLTAANKVEPFMIVFVDPKDRRREYWANDDFADFMALEVVPAVEKKYFSTIKTGRENRALLGASLGGIASFHTALKYPESSRKSAGNLFRFGLIMKESSKNWKSSTHRKISSHFTLTTARSKVLKIRLRLLNC